MSTASLFDDVTIVTPSAKSNEWYTPTKYIESAREVMGGIDLDPASCEMANRTVKATRYYTQKENGLMQPWHGRIWLNPPYALDKSQPNEKRSTVAKWFQKLLESYQTGQVQQGIILLTAQTDSKWFGLIWTYAICFADHKVRFYLPYGDPSRNGSVTAGHMLGTLFVYLGPHLDRFVEVFTQFGPVITPDGVHRKIVEDQPLQSPLWTGRIGY